MAWKWIWPEVGATPVTQGLDSEMFDRTDYPYTETFVREAIQNSLDARLNQEEPVLIRFGFHKDRLGKREALLAEAMEFRADAGLPVPGAWQGKSITWLTVQDFNTKGLLGALDDRSSDFWNYWLNFGLSNKPASLRGGRGIGRVTFLIASRVQTVLGITRRYDDKNVAGCGMCVLKAGPHNGEFKSTHAYLAKQETGSIYDLHEQDAFHQGLEELFALEAYSSHPTLNGLGLIIPYPHEDLHPDGILAAAVDHFAPAILNGSLVVEVDQDRLDDSTIREVGPFVADRIKSKGIGSGLNRYLHLIGKALTAEPVNISLSDPRERLSDQRQTEMALALQTRIEDGETVVLALQFPLPRRGGKKEVELRTAVAKTPFGKTPVDRLFREGMSLPDVKATHPGELDVVMIVEDKLLATYLNLCEGKAHLDLLESKEIRQKLEENGFQDGISVKRLVKTLPNELRSLLTVEITKPDESVFESLFSVADESAPKRRKGSVDKPLPPPPPSPPPPDPAVAAVRVVTLGDGFRLKANEQFPRYPVTVKAAIAYADGSRNPGWSELDFTPAQLKVESENCEIDFVRNRVVIRNWRESSSVEITGFDSNRELDVRMRVFRDASED